MLNSGRGNHDKYYIKKTERWREREREREEEQDRLLFLVGNNNS